jgi:ribosomal protein S18 acetylase RimI-like enzyme
MTSVLVRSAVVDDADAIARVHARSWQAAYRGLMPDHVLDGIDVEARARWHREHLRQPPAGSAVFVAVDTAEQTIGFTIVGESDDGAAVFAIYVDPERWGAGAGRALMDAAVAHLTAAGPRPVRLWTLDGNERARRFYERRGFVADGAVGSHALGDGLDVPTVRFTLDAA